MNHSFIFLLEWDRWTVSCLIGTTLRRVRSPLLANYSWVDFAPPGATLPSLRRLSRLEAVASGGGPFVAVLSRQDSFAGQIQKVDYHLLEQLRDLYHSLPKHAHVLPHPHRHLLHASYFECRPPHSWCDLGSSEAGILEQRSSVGGPDGRGAINSHLALLRRLLLRLFRGRH